MPGAPNRPPVTAAPVAPPADVAARRALRRLAPSRVALLQDLWKGAPSPELLLPFDRAETAFTAGDFAGATSALDQLSVRFAEPRWPTLPVPFRDLRVAIPAPQPPQWDPDHALAPAEKEAKKAGRDARTQLALARASIEWMTRRGLATDDLAPTLEAATTALGDGAAVDPGFWDLIDTIWSTVRDRVPPPKAGGTKVVEPPPDA